MIIDQLQNTCIHIIFFVMKFTSENQKKIQQENSLRCYELLCNRTHSNLVLFALVKQKFNKS